MNKIKLPSMAEYVSILGESSTFDKDITDWINEELGKLEKIRSFTKRISQQPNIGMVVPAVFEDGEWRVLEDPYNYDLYNSGYSGTDKDIDFLECQKYQTALDNVIFEGFEYDGSEEGFIYVKNGETLLIFDTENKTLFLYNSENNYTTEIKTIEYLTPYNLTLTPKFAKELGLI